MRALLQRVKQAAVSVEGETLGKIKHGLLIFLGVNKTDSERELKWLADKICSLRIFSDHQDKMNLSVQDVKGNLLVISQFTLYASCKKGRRPDFNEAAEPILAKKLYEDFLNYLKISFPQIQSGRFAAKMEVSLINDGPATFLLESPNS